jgi:hypothetical protein
MRLKLATKGCYLDMTKGPSNHDGYVRLTVHLELYEW